MGEARKSGRPGGHALVPQGLICNRKASDFTPSLSSSTGSSDCRLHVMVRRARDRQFEYLTAQQGALKDESGDEFWSNPQRGHDLVEMSECHCVATLNPQQSKHRENAEAN